MQGDDHEDSLVESEIDVIVTTTFDDQYNLFVQSYPVWSESESVVFINSYPQLVNLKVLRRQMRESGLCFMHAPVVLQHYLVSIYKCNNKERNEMEMIDIAKYIATVWKDERLLKYLLDDNFGGSSIDFLEEINFHINPRISYTQHSLPDPMYEREAFLAACLEWTQKLKFFPALVSNFEVDRQFASSGVSFLAEEIKPPVDPAKRNGHHAMVLIGIRPCTTYDYVFLLQNWWRGDVTNPLGRFFIEVSARYMFAARAQISFVNSPIPEIPTNFPKVYKPYVETSADTSEKMYEINVLPMYDAFLSYDWGVDGRNHQRIKKIHEYLQRKGLKCFIDELAVHGDMASAIQKGIESSRCFVVFLTQNYNEKIRTKCDWCYSKLNYAFGTLPMNAIILVILEVEMKDSCAWAPLIATRFVNQLPIDLSDAAKDPTFASDKLSTEIQRVLN